MRRRWAHGGLLLATALLAAACSSGSTTSQSSSTTAGASAGATSAATAGTSSGTVSVDVGNGTPIRLRTGKLKVALVMLDNTNSWEQHVISSAQAEAAKLGWQLSVFSAAFNVQTELNTLQTILSSHSYDAVAAVPVDGAQECKVLTQELPAAGILVDVADVPICGNSPKAAVQQWVPGSLTWIGGTGITIDFYESWLTAAATANPGSQQVLFMNGPPQITVDQTEALALKAWEPQHPDFHVTDLQTDFTTNGTYTAVTNYMNAHPGVTLLMSTGSEDMDRGALNALRALGKLGKVKLIDSGGTQYAFDQLKAGNIEEIFPYTPDFLGSQLIDSIKKAQSGASVPHFISDIPPNLGTFDHLIMLNKNNLNLFTPEY